jgi:hypothetical protein
MKTLMKNNKNRFYTLVKPISGRSLYVMLIILIFGSFTGKAQSLPEVWVRLNNPQYDCQTQVYCVDVEFQSDGSGDTLFGMNVRFFYDDMILEFLGMSDFAPGYASVMAPQVETGAGGAFFGITGPLEWVNGQVQLVDVTTIELPTTEWVRLFTMCFHVDDPASRNIENFCPSIIWDLQEDPPPPPGYPGFLPGDDGVVMTLVDPSQSQESIPTNENVVQYNWAYGGNPGGFGLPAPTICKSTICYQVPVSNWSIVLAIGLMVIASVFILKRRMNS